MARLRQGKKQSFDLRMTRPSVTIVFQSWALDFSITFYNNIITAARHAERNKFLNVLS